MDSAVAAAIMKLCESIDALARSQQQLIAVLLAGDLEHPETMAVDNGPSPAGSNPQSLDDA